MRLLRRAGRVAGAPRNFDGQEKPGTEHEEASIEDF